MITRSRMRPVRRAGRSLGLSAKRVHVSEMSNEHVDDPHKVVAEGQSVKAEVISIDPGERKIGLAMKSLIGREDEADGASFMTTGRTAPTSERATLGDLLASKLDKKGK